MNKTKLAMFLSLLLVLVMATGAFAAEVVDDYRTSDDGRSDYDSGETGIGASLIQNGDFTVWGTTLGPSDPWTFWRDETAGWTAGRLHEFDLAHPANPDGINNAMGWFIQHSGARSGGYYAGAWQRLSAIPAAGLYYVNVSVSAWEGGNTGPYNSVAWYAISDASNPAEVADEEWKELYPDQFVCATGDGICNYVGRDETVRIEPGQYFHIQVGRKFPEFFGHTMFIVDDISIVAAGGTVDTENGFYNWCDNPRLEDVDGDFKAHDQDDCDNLTEVRWNPRELR